MQQSMTGYGRSLTTTNSISISVEIKTLNSKFLDINLRIPSELFLRENDIRNLISDKLKRGKVLASINITHTDPEYMKSLLINQKLFHAYHKLFTDLGAGRVEQKDIFQLAIKAPDVLRKQELDPEQINWESIKSCLIDALNQCVEFRKVEGHVLQKKLIEYARNIEADLTLIKELDLTRLKHVKTRLRKGMDEIREKVMMDENRFEQELIYYLEKMDISEEKVRLKQHIEYFYNILDEIQAGKKLGFISQEMGREINTIGSKANDVAIQKVVVLMKDELEKIKEQALNIL